MKPYLIFDFDSTLVGVESLDELARIALCGTDDRDERLAEIERITAEGMAGRIGFGESLSRRLGLFAASNEHLIELAALLRTEITDSFKENLLRLREVSADMYVVSGGFSDYIVPVMREYGFRADRVLANGFTFGADGTVTGCDQQNVLAADGGKIRAVRNLALDGPVVMIGDGFTDFQVAEAGAADKFIAYVGHVRRPGVALRADGVARDFGEVARHLVQFDSYAGVA